MSILTDNPFVQAVGISAAIIGALALKYPDRAIFDEHRPGIAFKPGHPLVGTLPSLMLNSSKIHDILLRTFTDTRKLTKYVIQSYYGTYLTYNYIVLHLLWVYLVPLLQLVL